MVKVLNFLKNKRVQYVVIVWILLIKVVEIVAELLANIELLSFFELLGFGNISIFSRIMWNALVAITIVWLTYRLAKDTFQISLKTRQPSKMELLSIVLLLVWLASFVIGVFQFTLVASLPSASPQLEISKYYPPYNTTNNGLITYFIINETEREAYATLDLSKSVFSDPLSFYEIGEISMFGTENGGLSYFSLESSPIGQEMIEMKFFGNGTNGLDGWFANKIVLEKPLQVNESTTLILLLKLDPSSDNTAWTYVKLDLLSADNGEYSLTWKFHDKQINSMLYSNNRKMKMYLLGSAVEWVFFQFNIKNVFYTSFSSHPQFLIGIEYGVGAEADNAITANYLLARISDYPLKVCGDLVECVKPKIKAENSRICFEGITALKLYVTSVLKPCKEKKDFQFSFTKISRFENYEWDIQGEAEKRIRFNITNSLAKIFLNGKETTLKTNALKLAAYELTPSQGIITLTVVSEVDTYLIPTISIALTPSIILCLWKVVKSEKEAKKELIAFYF
jgi:hypothetical protein